MVNKEIQLSNRVLEIVTFYFNNPSLTYTDLSKQFNVSPQRISQIMKHPRVLQAFPILAKRHIKSLVPKAVEKLEHLMNQRENYAVSEKVVSKILDSEKVLEPQTHKLIHEIQMKSVKELQEIIEGSKLIPQQGIIDAEIVTNDNEAA